MALSIRRFRRRRIDARIQSGLSTCPKWEPRSRLGIYVGHSPAHAGTLALVLNPRTGHVSPQFHIVFDDLFTTVSFMNKNQLPPNWAELVKDSRELVTDERFNLAETWLFFINRTVVNKSSKTIWNCGET